MTKIEEIVEREFPKECRNWKHCLPYEVLCDSPHHFRGRALAVARAVIEECEKQLPCKMGGRNFCEYGRDGSEYHASDCPRRLAIQMVRALATPSAGKGE